MKVLGQSAVRQFIDALDTPSQATVTAINTLASIIYCVDDDEQNRCAPVKHIGILRKVTDTEYTLYTSDNDVITQEGLQNATWNNTFTLTILVDKLPLEDYIFNLSRTISGAYTLYRGSEEPNSIADRLRKEHALMYWREGTKEIYIYDATIRPLGEWRLINGEGASIEDYIPGKVYLHGDLVYKGEYNTDSGKNGIYRYDQDVLLWEVFHPHHFINHTNLRIYFEEYLYISANDDAAKQGIYKCVDPSAGRNSQAGPGITLDSYDQLMQEIQLERFVFCLDTQYVDPILVWETDRGLVGTASEGFYYEVGDKVYFPPNYGTFYECVNTVDPPQSTFSVHQTDTWKLLSNIGGRLRGNGGGSGIVGDGTISIQDRDGVQFGVFTVNQLASDTIEIPPVYDGTVTIKKSDGSDVGSFTTNEDGKIDIYLPEIPAAANDATITIKDSAGNTVGDFTTDQSTDETITLPAPPTVGNAQISLTKYLNGPTRTYGSFTVNQTSNASIEVDADYMAQMTRTNPLNLSAATNEFWLDSLYAIEWILISDQTTAAEGSDIICRSTPRELVKYDQNSGHAVLVILNSSTKSFKLDMSITNCGTYKPDVKPGTNTYVYLWHSSASQPGSVVRLENAQSVPNNPTISIGQYNDAIAQVYGTFTLDQSSAASINVDADYTRQIWHLNSATFSSDSDKNFTINPNYAVEYLRIPASSTLSAGAVLTCSTTANQYSKNSQTGGHGVLQIENLSSDAFLLNMLNMNSKGSVGNGNVVVGTGMNTYVFFWAKYPYYGNITRLEDITTPSDSQIIYLDNLNDSGFQALANTGTDSFKVGNNVQLRYTGASGAMPPFLNQFKPLTFLMLYVQSLRIGVTCKMLLTPTETPYYRGAPINAWVFNATILSIDEPTRELVSQGMYPYAMQGAFEDTGYSLAVNHEYQHQFHELSGTIGGNLYIAFNSVGQAGKLTSATYFLHIFANSNPCKIDAITLRYQYTYPVHDCDLTPDVENVFMITVVQDYVDVNNPAPKFISCHKIAPAGDAVLGDDFVDKTTDQTIGGVKTFTSEPVLPSKTTRIENSATKPVTEAQIWAGRQLYLYKPYSGSSVFQYGTPLTGVYLADLSLWVGYENIENVGPGGSLPRVGDVVIDRYGGYGSVITRDVANKTVDIQVSYGGTVPLSPSSVMPPKVWLLNENIEGAFNANIPLGTSLGGGTRWADLTPGQGNSSSNAKTSGDLIACPNGCLMQISYPSAEYGNGRIIIPPPSSGGEAMTISQFFDGPIEDSSNVHITMHVNNFTDEESIDNPTYDVKHERGFLITPRVSWSIVRDGTKLKCYVEQEAIPIYKAVQGTLFKTLGPIHYHNYNDPAEVPLGTIDNFACLFSMWASFGSVYSSPYVKFEVSSADTTSLSSISELAISPDQFCFERL